jgi:hypothetical protein
LPPIIDDGGRPQISGKSQVADRRPQETIGLYIFTCLSWGEQSGGEKPASYCPVAAASKIVISRWQTPHH